MCKPCIWCRQRTHIHTVYGVMCVHSVLDKWWTGMKEGGGQEKDTRGGQTQRVVGVGGSRYDILRPKMNYAYPIFYQIR